MFLWPSLFQPTFLYNLHFGLFQECAIRSVLTLSGEIKFRLPYRIIFYLEFPSTQADALIYCCFGSVTTEVLITCEAVSSQPPNPIAISLFPLNLCIVACDTRFYSMPNYMENLQQVIDFEDPNPVKI